MMRARPVQAALASAASSVVGGIVPILAVWLSSVAWLAATSAARR
jgi:VIT1/CCC1 family predicted Fe2+/Mn2+ transporter